jgi:hypothetical protein
VDDLDARLRHSVASRLNADVIDWQCPRLVDGAADGVLNGLYPLSNSDRAALRRTMIRMLSEWKATIDWFIQVTDVDWTFDTEAEQVLKGIVARRAIARQSRQPRAPDQGSDAALGKNRDHFIWPSNLAAPLPVFDNRSSASRPPAA